MEHPYTLQGLFGPPDEFDTWTQEHICNACGAVVLGHTTHRDWHNQHNI